MSSFSQSTYPKLTQDSLVVITPTQLKQTNLIFLEHDKLKKENSILLDKNNILLALNSKLTYTDSIRNIQVNSYLEELKKADKDISSLQKTLESSKDKINKAQKWVIGSLGISVGLLILLFVK